MTESDADLGTYPDTFPNNIQEHFWIQPGEPTVKPWISLGQLNNGLYFYFTAFSTNKDGRFYVNTVTEEVAVQKVAPVKFVTPSNPMFPNIGLSGTSFLPEISSARIPIPTVLETDTVSTITVVKSITPVIAGHMNLWISCRFSDIIEYSMDSVTYEKYVGETVPTE
jgi:hypothetical protein